MEKREGLNVKITRFGYNKMIAQSGVLQPPTIHPQSPQNVLFTQISLVSLPSQYNNNNKRNTSLNFCTIFSVFHIANLNVGFFVIKKNPTQF